MIFIETLASRRGRLERRTAYIICQQPAVVHIGRTGNSLYFVCVHMALRLTSKLKQMLAVQLCSCKHPPTQQKPASVAVEVAVL
ncbi:hypothetical protein BaRGS_00022203 [Batillaria attramentaria]|uniref:Uncharacterized protein n=1 Tax=Batillaria attramentaria TaxID=370345 RepID=A0ABD0KHJ8_9CAEN